MKARSLTPALLLCAAGGALGAAPDPVVRAHSLLLDVPIARARRPAPVIGVLMNTGAATARARCRLVGSAGVRVDPPGWRPVVRLVPGEDRELTWKVEGERAGPGALRLEVEANGRTSSAGLTVDFREPMAVRKSAVIPEPEPVKTPLLIGAHHCPLWEADRPEMWTQIVKHRERTPALGFYAGEDPEVADWETKWAVEHGVQFFIYCWYRTSQGGAVTAQFDKAIHDALFNSRYGDKMQFTIMWENQVRGRSGVSDERDLMENLLPYWIEKFFKRGNYLKVDGKPVLFIYRPEFLIQDLGSEEAVRAAFDKMREACRKAGFEGLTLLGEYRGLDANHLALMKRLGLDYTFAYCWHVNDNPSPARAIDTQMQYIAETQRLNVLPQVVTVSMGWTGWNDEGSIWRIPPLEFQTLLRRAKDFVATLPAEELGSRMLLLDNWNEWGEGHWLAPHRQEAFGYLDAIRSVFAPDAGPHTDLLPEDIGKGPYDRPYRDWLKKQSDVRRQSSKRVTRGAPQAGLVAWWTFDEPDGTPVALDWSGAGRGGEVLEAGRAPGIDGSALVCEGGSVAVPSNPAFSTGEAVSVECWVKTDTAGQDNKWLVNRVFGGATASGYRLGVLAGKPCWEVPLTEWSHHLSADVHLPTGRWVHLAGTFDGKVMRVYVDGEERGRMDRPGPVNPSDMRIVLGSYEVKHPSHFTGLLDEVKLWNRCLTPVEVRASARRYAGTAK